MAHFSTVTDTADIDSTVIDPLAVWQTNKGSPFPVEGKVSSIGSLAYRPADNTFERIIDHHIVKVARASYR
jgi:hypothetical protein